MVGLYLTSKKTALLQERFRVRSSYGVMSLDADVSIIVSAEADVSIIVSSDDGGGN